MMIQISFDDEADALYIKLRDDAVEESREVAPGVIIDFNRDGRVVGIEVLRGVDG